MTAFTVLEMAKNKILEGDFSLAASYYLRAKEEGVPESIVDMRYLTKNYLVYPLEYESSTNYFIYLKELKELARQGEPYLAEYKQALHSLENLKTLFLRAVALFYFSDIEVCRYDSVIVKEIFYLQKYLAEHKNEIIEQDIYQFGVYAPSVKLEKLKRELDVIQVFCLNLLLSYTAVQDSVYKGKKYSAISIDYGYFIDTDIRARDAYYTWATLKPRLSLLHLEAYYEEYLTLYKQEVAKIKNFNSPVELRQALKELILHKDTHSKNAKEFLLYAKHFEKTDGSRESFLTTLNKFNPLAKLNLMNLILDKRRVCSFEIGNYFTRKKWLGVCDMLSSAKGWSLDTVRWVTILLGCFGIGVLGYIGLAIAMKMGYYIDLNIEKH